MAKHLSENKVNPIKDMRLINRISDILLEFAETAKEDFTTSDLQGLAMAKSMNIITEVRMATGKVKHLT